MIIKNENELSKQFRNLELDIETFDKFVANVKRGKNDFTIETENNTVRFINDQEIDEIMQDELSSDFYILGSFTAEFLARYINLDLEIIKVLQESDKFEVLGKHIMKYNYVPIIQKEYAKADSYGHHFNHWDGYENTLTFQDSDDNLITFYAFIEKN